MTLWKWYKEIKAVGWKDWRWFVIYLKRDEFSPKLSVENYWRGYDLHHLIFHDLRIAKEKAHRISITLEDVK